MREAVLPAVKSSSAESATIETTPAASAPKPATVETVAGLEQQSVGGALLLDIERRIERPQRAHERIEPFATVGQTVLARFETVERISGTALSALIARSCPPTPEFGLVAHRIGKLIPQALLSLCDAQLVMKKIEAAFEPVAPSATAVGLLVELPARSNIRHTRIGPLRLDLVLLGWGRKRSRLRCSLLRVGRASYRHGKGEAQRHKSAP